MHAASARQRGFTLIELLVVLAVLGLLLMAAAPSVSVWIRNMQIRGVAESMLTGLQQARLEAMRRNQNVQFSLVSGIANNCTLTSTGRSWVVSMDDPTSAGSKCASAPSPTTAPRIVTTYVGGEGNSAASSVTVAAKQSDNTSNADTVTFDPFGRVSGSTGIARITVDNATTGNDFRQLRIVVSGGGNVRMCDPAISASSTDPRRCP